mmetsp:Transcript_20658/g.57594  ORF Transcript_20658/g.57594 Transcript_20658/m.57594 type:complete len:283 (+) Transcript_20658:543-1391(+)
MLPTLAPILLSAFRILAGLLQACVTGSQSMYKSPVAGSRFLTTPEYDWFRLMLTFNLTGFGFAAAAPPAAEALLRASFSSRADLSASAAARASCLALRFSARRAFFAANASQSASSHSSPLPHAAVPDESRAPSVHQSLLSHDSALAMSHPASPSSFFFFFFFGAFCARQGQISSSIELLSSSPLLLGFFDFLDAETSTSAQASHAESDVTLFLLFAGRSPSTSTVSSSASSSHQQSCAVPLSALPMPLDDLFLAMATKPPPTARRLPAAPAPPRRTSLPEP